MTGNNFFLHLFDLHFGDQNETNSAKRTNTLNKLLLTLKNLPTEWNTYDFLAWEFHMILSGYVHGMLKAPDSMYQKSYLFTGGSSYIKSFCRGSRGTVFSKRVPLAAGGKVF